MVDRSDRTGDPYSLLDLYRTVLRSSNVTFPYILTTSREREWERSSEQFIKSLSSVIAVVESRLFGVHGISCVLQTVIPALSCVLDVQIYVSLEIVLVARNANPHPLVR